MINLSGYRRLAGQAMTVNTTSTQSNAAPAFTKAVLLTCIGVNGAHGAVGSGPVATSADVAVAGNTSILLNCMAGEKVAGIQSGASPGNLSVTFLG